MKVLNCDIVDVSQAAVAELPPLLLGPALQRLLKDGHLLVRNGKPTPTLYRLQPVEISGGMITAAGEEPPATKKPHVVNPRWRKVTKAQAKAIGAGLRKYRLERKLTQAVFAKQLGTLTSTLSKYEMGRIVYISQSLAMQLRRVGLGNLIPKGGN